MAEEDVAAARLQAIHRGRSARRNAPPPVVVPPALVVTGPCGLGKSYLLWLLLEKTGDDFARPVSHTTRAPRPGEVHGVDYFFIKHERMRILIERGSFAEHTEVDGQLFGTSHAAIKKVAMVGRSCALCVNVDGATQLRKHGIFDEDSSTFVFVAPTSLPTYEARLRKRGGDTEAAVRHKLRRSRTEMFELTEGTGAAMFGEVLFTDDAADLLDDLMRLAADVRPLTL